MYVKLKLLAPVPILSTYTEFEALTTTLRFGIQRYRLSAVSLFLCYPTHTYLGAH